MKKKYSHCYMTDEQGRIKKNDQAAKLDEFCVQNNEGVLRRSLLMCKNRDKTYLKSVAE